VLRVNLRWTSKPAGGGGGGLFKRRSSGAIDLDLGAMYEYTDGSKGVVQALGKAFRDRHTWAATRSAGSTATTAAAVPRARTSSST
jgi:tellurite resistance protein TerA